MRVRTIIMATAMILLCTMQAGAQILPDGYYRITSNQYNNTFGIANNKFNYLTIIQNGGGGGSQMYKSSNNAKTGIINCTEAYLRTDIHKIEDGNDPSTVIYLKYNSTNKGYDLIGQGTSLLDLATGEYHHTSSTIWIITIPAGWLQFKNIYIKLSEGNSSGTYAARMDIKAQTTASGLASSFNLSETRYLADNNGLMALQSSSADWKITKVESLTLSPSVSWNDSYYTTFFAAFPFKLSTNTIRAYVVEETANKRAKMKIIASNGGTVPAGTPVVLQCSEPTAEIIPTGEPIINATDIDTRCAATEENNNTIQTTYDNQRKNNRSEWAGTNLLKGTYFKNTDTADTNDEENPSTIAKYSGWGSSGFSDKVLSVNNYTTYSNTSTNKMRALGVNKAGTIGFFRLASGTKMAANKAWLDITSMANVKDESLVIEWDDEDTDLVALPVEEERTEDSAIYDLSGRRMPEGTQLRRGVYIIGGRKVFIQ